MESYVEVTPLPGIPSIDSLSYSVPEALAASLETGARVLVPLGRRRVTALVTAKLDTAPVGIKCRDIEALLDHEAVVPPDLLELMDWMASYYMASRAEVLSLVLSRGLRASSTRMVVLKDPDAARNQLGKDIVAQLEKNGGSMQAPALARKLGLRSIDRGLASLLKCGAVEVREVLNAPKVNPRFESWVRLRRIPDEASAAALFARAPRRREIFEYLAATPSRCVAIAELKTMFPSVSSPLQALAEAGLVEVEKREHYRTPPSTAETDPPPQLSPAQSAALESVEKSLGSFDPFLLHGVTASGKTEVYMRLIAAVLQRGGSALLLVPEISLTHQLLSRLHGRFGNTVAVLHSELSAGERWDQWRRICRGEASIAVGARSAVLAPMLNLALIIVDEEHDGSYKQEDGVRYHARDVAVRRAQLAACPIVLGSATPSLESWRNCEENRYTRLSMPERVTENPLPRILVADLRGEDLAAKGGISDYLAERMAANFDSGGQTLLFLNRRGYAHHLQCYRCGEVLECPDCSVGMTLHQQQRELRCHHCNRRQREPQRCPACKADALVSEGLGTQRLELAVQELLPAARIARLDRDSTSRKGSGASILLDWRKHRVDVLIGTQMIAKGHDVEGVTLVGVIHADSALGLPDFRAAERTFQLLTQVAGRAGRGGRQGLVVIQSYQPEHPLIRAAVEHDYHSMARSELRDREDLGYPPAARMVQLRFFGRERAAVERCAYAAARSGEDILRSVAGVLMRGPAPAAVERVKSNFRFQLQLRGSSGAAVRHVAALIRERIAASATKAGVRVVVDVDPFDMA